MVGLVVLRLFEVLRIVKHPSLSSTPTLALLSLQQGQSLQDCRDAVEAGLSEARCPGDKARCFRAMVQIAGQFGEDDLGREAGQELEGIEEEEDGSQLSSVLPVSDVEISESESEGETAPTRRPRGPVWKVNEKGETPLHQACIQGKTEKVILISL